VARSTLRASGTWRSLVAHLLWEQGVASSNLAVPIRRGLGDKAFLLVGHWAQPVCEEPDGSFWKAPTPRTRGEAAGIEPAQDFNRHLCVTGKDTLACPSVREDSLNRPRMA
jgi:hypothetical protein